VEISDDQLQLIIEASYIELAEQLKRKPPASAKADKRMGRKLG
jgi:hypothetical protein